MSAPALVVEDLSVMDRDHAIVAGVSLRIEAGQFVAVLGLSGAGKTTLARAILGLLSPTLTLRARALAVEDRSLMSAANESFRRERIGAVFQDPYGALNPYQSVDRHVRDALPTASRADRQTHLARFGLTTDTDWLSRRPETLSGGERQRVGLALAARPAIRLLVADEPTSSLDSVTAEALFRQMKEMTRTSGSAVLVVTHNLALASAFADRVVVLHAGEVVDDGPPDVVFTSPRHATTGLLAAAEPGRHVGEQYLPVDAPGAPSASFRRTNAEIVVEQLAVAGRAPAAFWRRPPALILDNVSFSIAPGETAGLFGASGSGKTTLCKALVGLRDPVAGGVRIGGSTWPQLKGRARRQQRQRVQLVLQDAQRALPPSHDVRQLFLELSDGPTSDVEARAAPLLARLGLRSEVLERRVRTLSGGERQRVSIARSLSLNPDILIADEITSALDPISQARVLNLLRDCNRGGQTQLIVSHDADLIAFMGGRRFDLSNGRLLDAAS